jgi:predicted dehydrogenase
MTVKVGFIGCGDVSELHYQGICTCSQVELAGIYDVNTDLMKQRTKEWEVRSFDSTDALLEDKEIQAVFVLTPAEYHYRHVMAALYADKHVLVEKPVADQTEQIEEMEELADSKGLQCIPAHNYIYSPDMYRLKRNIEAGNFGQIAVTWILYHIHHSEELCARYPGIIHQIGTHLFYVHRYLFGAPASMSARSTRFLYPHLECDDQTIITLSMPDGSMSNLFASFAVSDHSTTPWSFIVKVLGTEGSVQFSWQDVVFDRALGTLSQSYGRYEETYEHEVRYFVQKCILSEKPPLSTLEDARMVLQMVHRAERDAEKNRSGTL